MVSFKAIIVIKALILVYLLKKHCKIKHDRKVYEALELDSRKGGFVNLNEKDRIDPEISLTNDEIKKICQYINGKKLLN